jgi:chromosome segregation protein
LQYAELNAIVEESQKVVAESEGSEIESEVQLTDLQAKVEEMRTDVLVREKQLEISQADFSAKQILVQQSELKIQELRFEIETARRNEVMTGSLLSEQKARHELLSAEQTELNDSLIELRTELEELSVKFEERNKIYQNSSSRIGGADEELTTKRRELFSVGQLESSLDARVNSLTAQLADVREREEQGQAVLSELREKQFEFDTRKNRVVLDLETETQKQAGLVQDLANIEVSKKELAAAVEQKKIETAEFKDQLNEVASRLYGLENLQSNFEGFEDGVKSVMLWQKVKAEKEVTADGSVNTYFRPVSEIVEVPAEYEVAMEAALGTRLQILLSQDSQVSLEALAHLKQQKSGRSSFLSDQSVQGAGTAGRSPELGQGVLCILKDVVRHPEMHNQAVESLLGQIAIVEDLRTALSLRPDFPGWSFVTPEGDALSSDGVITGGASESADSGVLRRRREIKELSQKKDEWAGKLQLALAALKKDEDQLVSLTKEFETAQKKKIEQEILIAGLKKDLERSENELHNATMAVERQGRECSRLTEQVNSQEEKIHELQEHLFEAREKKVGLDAEVNGLTDELQNLKTGFDGLQSEVNELRTSVATKTQEVAGVQRQLEMVTRSVDDLNSQLNRMSEDQEMYSEQMTESQYQLEAKKIEFEKLIDEVHALKTSVSQQKNEYEIIDAELRAHEENIHQLNKQVNERQARMNEAKLSWIRRN